METINIRKATPQDIQTVIELNRSIFVNNPKYDGDLIENFMDTPRGMQIYRRCSK
jgi:hypothetical protein